MRSGALLGLLFAVGCTSGDPSYQAPAPSTDPEVTVPYPEARRRLLGETAEEVTFGQGSSDLVVVVASQIEGEPNRVLDLARPNETRLVGYGIYAGYQEIYRRSIAVDGLGVHGVRTAVYRTDPDGNHTNAWFSHWASSGREIYQTALSVWDWQGGSEDLITFDGFAWPLFGHVEASSYYFAKREFGLIPGMFARTDHSQVRVLSTDIAAPTSGIEDCTLFSYWSAEQERMVYLAYVHEDEGLVEVAYDWTWLSEEDDQDWRIEPIDGFGLDGPLHGPRQAEAAPVPYLGGTWSGTLPAYRYAGYALGTVPDDAEETELVAELEIDPMVTDYREEAGRAVLHAKYRDPEVGERDMVGEFRTTGTFRLLSTGDPELVTVTGALVGATEAELTMEIRLWKATPDQSTMTTQVVLGALEREGASASSLD